MQRFGLALTLILMLGSKIDAQIVNPANGHTYVLTASPQSLATARASAAALGGYLVAINDAAEQTWLSSTFSSAQGYWIGLSDESIEGTYLWDSGEPVSYTNWCNFEPNNLGNEDYVSMNWCPPTAASSSFGRWNDFNGSQLLYGIVELQLAPPTALSPCGAAPHAAALTWSSGTPGVATTYDVQVAGSSLFSGLLVDAHALVSTSLPIAFPADRSYWWRVRAVSPFATSAWSTACMLTTAEVAGASAAGFVDDFSWTGIDAAASNTTFFQPDTPLISYLQPLTTQQDGAQSWNRIWRKQLWQWNDADCFLDPLNATVSSGMLRLTTQAAIGGYSPEGAQVRTSEEYGFGSYRVRMKSSPGTGPTLIGDGIGVVNGFFVYKDAGGGAFWEIDIEVRSKLQWLLGHPIDFTVHGPGACGGQSQCHFSFNAPFDPSAAFHVYGFDWRADGIDFFVDPDPCVPGSGWVGHVPISGQVPALIPQSPGSLILNNWTCGPNATGDQRAFAGMSPAIATQMLVDWVRYTPVVNAVPSAIALGRGQSVYNGNPSILAYGEPASPSSDFTVVLQSPVVGPALLVWSVRAATLDYYGTDILVDASDYSSWAWTTPSSLVHVATLSIPAGIPCGSTLVVQNFVIDPLFNQVLSSNALEIRYGP